MRYKLLYVHPQFLIEISKEGLAKAIVVSNALPSDAKFVRAFTDDTTGWGRIGIVIESNSFPELKDGDEIPVIDPIFNRVN